MAIDTATPPPQYSPPQNHESNETRTSSSSQTNTDSSSRTVDVELQDLQLPQRQRDIVPRTNEFGLKSRMKKLVKRKEIREACPLLFKVVVIAVAGFTVLLLGGVLIWLLATVFRKLPSLR